MARSPKRGRQSLFVGVGQVAGVIVTDPVGVGIAITYEELATRLGLSGLGGVAWAPLTNGAEPIELVSDGAGACVMVPFTP